MMNFQLTVLPFVAAAAITSVFFVALIRDMNHRYAAQLRVAERVRTPE